MLLALQTITYATDSLELLWRECASKSDNVKFMGVVEADEFYIKAGLK